LSKYTRRDFVRTLGVGAAGLLLPRFAFGAEDERRRPNIIFILADDMGWMDSTIYGSRYYETPNLERLAARSMLFTDAYAANPLCSPTRASIMTGKYPARLRITTPAGHLPPLPDEPLLPDKGAPHQKMIMPRSRRFLPLGERTIAEALKEVGYRTGFVGKWHLGHEEYWPEKQGFDVNIAGGQYPGPPSYHSPYKIKTLPDGPEGEYITDRLTDEALKFIDQSRSAPFFLCLWHYAVHGPWGHKEEITERYLGRKDPRGKQGNPIMASMLWSLDESVGRLLNKLDELKLSENTIIIFFSDNGGNVHERIGPDLLPPTNNSPLRGGKAMMYEGGTREPMLVCWPGVVKPGSRCSEVVSSIDFYPTMLEMAGAKRKDGQILDGLSLVPLLKRGTSPDREAIFCHFPHGLGRLSTPSTYVRKGDWKLIRIHVTSRHFPEEYELYNLKEDLGETNNLAAKMPDKVKELSALIDGFLKETGALLPKPNPAYRPELRSVNAWRSSRDCTLSVKDGVLLMQSTGGDPFMMTGDVPWAAGDLVAKFRMRSQSKGPGQFFWATKRARRFGPKSRLNFEPEHDGQWHEYSVEFRADYLLTALRIDPSTGPGNIEFAWIRLFDAKGEMLDEWKFTGAVE